MKRTFALICAAALLLTGCDGGEVSFAPEPITADATAEALCTSDASDAETYEAPAGEQDNISAEDTAEPPSEEIYTPLTYVFDEQYWNVSHGIAAGSLEAQFGYDTPVDVTQLSEFEYVLSYLDYLEESEMYEEKQKIINNNYSYTNYSICYVGSEAADWLYGVSYYLAVDGPPAAAYYSKLFCVKDGVVTDTIAEFTDCGMGIGTQIYRDEDIIIPTDTAVYSLDRENLALTKLFDTKLWCRLIAAEDGYIIYSDGDSRIKVYYTESRDIVTTEIYRGLQDGVACFFTEDAIIYHDLETDDLKRFDIQTRECDFVELTADEETALIIEQRTVSDGTWSAYKTNEAIEVTNLATGETKLYSFAEMSMQYGVRYPYLRCIDNGILYMEDSKREANMLAAFDLAIDTVYMLRIDADGNSNGDFEHDPSSDLMIFTSYIDETAAAVQLIR